MNQQDIFFPTGTCLERIPTTKFVRAFLTSLFYKEPPPYFAYPTLFPILFNPFSPLSCDTTALFVALFLWVNKWLGHILCYFTKRYYGSTLVEPWYLCTWRTLQAVFYAARRQAYWGLTFFASTVISNTHTQSHTEHFGVNRLNIITE